MFPGEYRIIRFRNQTNCCLFETYKISSGSVYSGMDASDYGSFKISMRVQYATENISI